MQRDANRAFLQTLAIFICLCLPVCVIITNMSYNVLAAETQGSLRQSLPEVMPVDRTTLVGGTRTPPRRLRMD